MSTTTYPVTFQKFDAALSKFDWSPFSLTYRTGYEPGERIYQVGECEFRVKETPQGFTDGYGLTTYLRPEENPENPETLDQLREKVIQRLEESYRVQMMTRDSHQRTLLLQHVWETEILPQVVEELEFFQLTNYDLVVQDNSFRLHLGEEPRIDGYKVDDYIILRGFFNPLDVSIYALYLNKLFQFFGMLHEPGDKDWDGTMYRVQSYIDRFYNLAKDLRNLLEDHLQDERFLPPREFPGFMSQLDNRLENKATALGKPYST